MLHCNRTFVLLEGLINSGKSSIQEADPPEGENGRKETSREKRQDHWLGKWMGVTMLDWVRIPTVEAGPLPESGFGGENGVNKSGKMKDKVASHQPAGLEEEEVSNGHVCMV